MREEDTHLQSPFTQPLSASMVILKEKQSKEKAHPPGTSKILAKARKKAMEEEKKVCLKGSNQKHNKKIIEPYYRDFFSQKISVMLLNMENIFLFSHFIVCGLCTKRNFKEKMYFVEWQRDSFKCWKGATIQQRSLGTHKETWGEVGHQTATKRSGGHNPAGRGRPVGWDLPQQGTPHSTRQCRVSSKC